MENKRIIVKTVGDKVVLEIEGEGDYMVNTPEIAAQIGKSMMDAAVSLGLDIRVQAPKRTISAMKRLEMTNRATLMLRSLQNRSNTYKAAQIVDTILEMAQ